jgi:hypothetical protein
MKGAAAAASISVTDSSITISYRSDGHKLAREKGEQ